MSAQQATPFAVLDSSTDLRERICVARPSSSPAERQVANWVLRQPSTVFSLSVVAITYEAGISQPTAIHFHRSMDYHGLSDFELWLAQGNVARGTTSTRIAAPSSTRTLQNAIDSFTTLQDRFDPYMLDAVVALVDSVYRIDLYGFGSSGAVVLDAQTKFFRYGIPTNAYGGPCLVSMSLNMLQAGNVVIAISKSGTLPELQTTVKHMHELGVCVIAVTTPGGPLAVLTDVALPTDADDIVADRSMVARLLHLALLDALVLKVTLREGSALQYVDQPKQH